MRHTLNLSPTIERASFMDHAMHVPLHTCCHYVVRRY